MKEQKKVFGPADVPFETGDGMLAFALYLAGVPFANEGMWCRNTYTREMLRDYGFNGVDIRLAAKAAVKANQKGNVRFSFKQTPRLRELLDAYTEQEKRIAEESGNAATEFAAINEADIEQDIRSVKLACLVLKIRGQFMNGWKNMIPHIRIKGEGRVTKTPVTDGRGRIGTQTSYPGFKEFSSDATDEILKHMELL